MAVIHNTHISRFSDIDKHTNEITARKGTFPSTRALITLCLATVLITPSIYATQPILPMLSQEFHISASIAGLTLTSFNLTLAISLLLMGPISDRIGRRSIIIVVSLILVIPTFVASLAPNYPLLLVTRAFQGILASGISAIGVSYIGDEFSDRQRGVAIAWYTTALSTSSMLGRVGGGIIAGYFGWRAMFGALAISTLIGATLLAVFLPRANNFHAASSTSRAFVLMAKTFRRPVLLGGYLIGFLLGIVLLGFFDYVSYYLSNPPYSLTTEQLGLIFLLYVLGFLTPIAGKISLRTGRPVIIGIAMFAMMAGILLTLIPSVVMIIIGIGFLTLGILSAYGLTNAFVNDHSGPFRGGATSLYLCGWYSGGALGAYAVGPIWDAAGWHGVILALTGVIVLTMLVLYTITRPHILAIGRVESQ